MEGDGLQGDLSFQSVCLFLVFVFLKPQGVCFVRFRGKYVLRFGVFLYSVPFDLSLVERLTLLF